MNAPQSEDRKTPGITIHMVACSIATRIRDDICDRSGLGNSWDEIDHEIQQDIINAWVEIATQEIGRRG